MTESKAQRLRELLEYARRHSDYYTELLPPVEEGLPADPRETLARLPPLTRESLQRHGARFVARGVDESTFRRARTSGTTGQPVEVVLDARARAAEEGALASHLTSTLGNAEWKRHPLIHLVLHAGTWSRSAPSPYLPEATVTKWNLLQAWECDERGFAKTQRWLNGAVVTASPSILRLISSRVAAHDHSRPLAIVLSGEQVAPELVTRLRAAFECPVLALYTLTEAGIVGLSCPAGGYHPASAVDVEIVDDEILVTPLENFAMPLFRYRTGERGHWLDRSCPCGLGARFEVAGGRHPRWLVTDSACANVAGLAKVLAGFELDSFEIHQERAGAVTVSYTAATSLSPGTAAAVESVVRIALGPDVAIDLTRRDFAAAEAAASELASTELPMPRAPSLDGIAEWLRARLTGVRDVSAAIVTGSALEPGVATRFSDVDLVAFHATPHSPAAVALARSLRADFPRLAVHTEILEGLSRRAPLLSCRLLSEHRLVAGAWDPTTLCWPTQDDIAREARFWAQSAQAEIWLRVTSPGPAEDPVRCAWIASKFGLTALRYLVILQGARQTGASAVFDSAEADPVLRPVVNSLLELASIAREHRPPPLASRTFAETAMMGALDAVRTLAAAVAP